MKPLPVRSDHAPRLSGVAIALGLLMPGLGHLYCGQVRRGLTVWALVLAALIGGLLAWARWLFVPLGPLTLAAGSYLALQIVLIADIRRIITTQGAGYRLRPINHGLSYLAVFLGLAMLPLVITVAAVERWMVGSVAIQDRAMFPQLLPGDQLLYDRAAYAEQPPRIGELVVWGDDARAVRVARVVARAGETVHLRDGQPFIDGEPPIQAPLDDLKVARFGPADQSRLDALAGFVESRPSAPAVRPALTGAGPARDEPAPTEDPSPTRAGLGDHARFIVTYDRAIRRSGRDPSPITLADDELYVLGDNRDEAVATRAFGRIALGDVRGRPRHIWRSTGPESSAREGRFGLEVR